MTPPQKTTETTETETLGQFMFHLNSRKSMRYDISKSTAPAMPNLGKGTECIKILLTQASKDMHEPLVPMLFPILGAHMSGSEFQYPDLSWKEMCGMMANLVGDSGCNKGQLTNLVEAICHDFRHTTRLKRINFWNELARLAGVSDNTFRRYLNTRREELAEMGVAPRAKLLPPRAVKFIIDDYCIEIPENFQ